MVREKTFLQRCFGRGKPLPYRAWVRERNGERKTIPQNQGGGRGQKDTPHEKGEGYGDYSSCVSGDSGATGTSGVSASAWGTSSLFSGRVGMQPFSQK